MKIKLLTLLLVLVSHLASQAQSGYLDTTFNENGPTPGKKSLQSGSQGRDLAVDDLGRIVIASCSTNYSFDIFVHRLSPNGLKLPFGQDSSMTINFATHLTGSSYGASHSVKLQPDGKILIAGYVRIGSDQLLVIRLNANGSLDNSFSGDGFVTLDLSIGDDYARDMALQSTGKIVVVGSANGKIIAIRLNTDGSVDTGFNGGTGAFVSTGISSEQSSEVALRQDSIFIAGDYDASGYRYFTALKLSPNGAFIWRSNITSGASSDYLPSLVVQPDGKVVLAGAYNYKIVRLLQDGTIDPTLPVTQFNTGTLTDILLLPDGKMILSGYVYCSPSYCYMIMKIDQFGIPDNSFGTNGKLSIPSTSSVISYKSAISKDKKLLIVSDESTTSVIVKIQARSVMHIVGSDFVLPKSAETFKVTVPATWAGYTYEWTYSDPSAYFITPYIGQSVTLYFTDSTSSGTLTCYAKSAGSVIAFEQKEITVNSGPSNASELAAVSCQPEVTDCINGYIDFFSLGSINNQFSGCSNNGYSDFTRSNFADTLVAGGVYSAKIIIGASGAPTNVGIWIDYNNDGNFNNTDEFVGEGNNSEDISVVNVTNIIFKNKEGYDGPKRLRVRSRPSDKFTAAEYCTYTSSALEGETEDYLIVISEQSIMEAPQIITPNDDGKNDYFVIRGIDPKTGNKNKLTVFDRMGKVQYTSDQYENNWNGIGADGDKLDPGTYYYVFTKDEDDFIRGFLEIRY